MTLKTVNLHRSIFMTTMAEMFLTFNAGYMTIFVRLYMAVDAFCQTYRFITNTLMHSFIAFMQKVFHVISTLVILGPGYCYISRFDLSVG